MGLHTRQAACTRPTALKVREHEGAASAHGTRRDPVHPVDAHATLALFDPHGHVLPNKLSGLGLCGNSMQFMSSDRRSRAY